MGGGGGWRGERARLDVVAGAVRRCSLVAQRLGPRPGLLCLLHLQVQLRLLLPQLLPLLMLLYPFDLLLLHMQGRLLH